MSNPTNGVWEFDGSLAGTTESGSTSFTGVDPIRYDAGLWLEEGTTNFWPNPDAFIDTAGIASDLGSEGTLTRDVDGGVTSCHLERTGSTGVPTNLYNLSSIAGISEGQTVWIAAVSVYDVALDDATILAHYKAGIAAPGGGFS